METLVGDFLTNITIPANALVGGDEEVIVEVKNVGVILIERVTVNSELNLLAETLTDVVDIGKELITASGIGSRSVPVSSVGSIDGTKLDVEDHVVEEVTELRDGKLDLRIEASGAGLNRNLVIFITNSGKWLAFIPNRSSLVQA